jgi:hypothetical protein
MLFRPLFENAARPQYLGIKKVQHDKITGGQFISALLFS